MQADHHIQPTNRKGASFWASLVTGSTTATTSKYTCPSFGRTFTALPKVSKSRRETQTFKVFAGRRTSNNHSLHLMIRHAATLCLPVAVVSKAIIYPGFSFGLRGEQSIHLHHQIAGPTTRLSSRYMSKDCWFLSSRTNSHSRPGQSQTSAVNRSSRTLL